MSLEEIAFTKKWDERDDYWLDEKNKFVVTNVILILFALFTK